jgi:cytochrome c2
VIAAFAFALSGCGGGAPTQAQSVSGGNAENGKQLIEQYGCGGCHEIGGAKHADGRVGPTLEDFRDKEFIAAGLPNKPPDVERWIMHPQQILPGSFMPDLGVNRDQARDIVAYLYTQ